MTIKVSFKSSSILLRHLKGSWDIWHVFLFTWKGSLALWKKVHLSLVLSSNRTTTKHTKVLPKSLKKTWKQESPCSAFHSQTFSSLFWIPRIVLFCITTGETEQISPSCPAHCSWGAALWLHGGLVEGSPRDQGLPAAGPCQFRRAAKASRADHTGCRKHCHRKHHHSCNTQDSHAWGVAGVNRQLLFIPGPYLSTTFIIHKEGHT